MLTLQAIIYLHKKTFANVVSNIMNIKILFLAIYGIVFTPYLFANNLQILHVQSDKTSCALGFGLSNNLVNDGVILGDSLNVVYENAFHGELITSEIKPSFFINTYNTELHLLKEKSLSYKNQELVTSAFRCFSSLFINNYFIVLMRLNENSKGIYLFDINKGITTKSFDVLEPSGHEVFNYMTYDSKDSNIIIAGVINNIIYLREYSLGGKITNKKLNCNTPVSAVNELAFTDKNIISITKSSNIKEKSSIISIFDASGSLIRNTKYNGEVRYLDEIDDTLLFIQSEKVGRRMIYRIIYYNKEKGEATRSLTVSDKYVIDDYTYFDEKNHEIQLVILEINKLHILKYKLDATLINEYNYELPGLYYNINFVQELDNCIYIGMNYLVNKRAIKSTQMEFSLLKINK